MVLKDSILGLCIGHSHIPTTHFHIGRLAKPVYQYICRYINNVFTREKRVGHTKRQASNKGTSLMPSAVGWRGASPAPPPEKKKYLFWLHLSLKSRNTKAYRALPFLHAFSFLKKQDNGERGFKIRDRKILHKSND